MKTVDFISLFIALNLPIIQNAQMFHNPAQESLSMESARTDFRKHPSDLFTLSSIHNVNMRSSEFGGYPVKNQVFYCSSDRILGPIFTSTAEEKKPLYKLYKANRNNQNLESPEIVGSLKKIHTGPICATPDEKYMYITADNIDVTGKVDRKPLAIYKTKIGDDFETENFVAFKFNSPNYSVGHPAISRDGKILYFASDMPGGKGGVDLYKVDIHEDGTYGNIQNLGPTVNTSGDDFFPWIASDGSLFFTSDGHAGYGGLDIFMAYTGKSGKFGNITNLGSSINSKFDDFAFVLLDDNESGYLSSNREGGKGKDDIYNVSLSTPLASSYELEGTLTDTHEDFKLEGVTVQLQNEKGETVAETTTDENGYFLLPVDKTKNYRLLFTKDDYLAETMDVSTNDIQLWKPISVEEDLEKDPNLALLVEVTDKDSKEPLRDVNVIIVDNILKDTIGSFNTGKGGVMEKSVPPKKMGEKISYDIILKKPGYVAGKKRFRSKVDKYGAINLSETLALEMAKIDEGKDLGKLIDLNPIYFDLGKFNIRPDAAKELDKIVEVLMDNPKISIELGSHTDSRGRSKSNQYLSKRRAKASAKYLKQRISNPERITSHGYGESKPVNNCVDGVDCPESKHALNRRTEFKIVKH